MGDKSRINWTDATWNLASGCTRVSEGCRRCYIQTSPPLRIHRRRFTITCPDCGGVGATAGHAGTCPGCGGERMVESDRIGASTGVQLHPERLDQPLRWARPRKVFVGSLTDMFHDDVPDDLLAAMFAVMAVTGRHTYQLLTKRPARMRALLTSEAFEDQVDLVLRDWMMTGRITEHACAHAPRLPLPNVWLGVTVENQAEADRRIPILEATPAAVRWLSCEPLLGPVNLTPCNCRGTYTLGCARHDFGSLTDTQMNARAVHIPNIDWVVIGGESGANARPMHPKWASALASQAADHDIPVWFKQWGQWAPAPATVEPLPGETPAEHEARNARTCATHTLTSDGTLTDGLGVPTPGEVGVRRHRSKDDAGHTLDGIMWRQWPRAAQTAAALVR